MLRCDHRTRCHFYHEVSTKLGLTVSFITNYCEGPGYGTCARYLLASRGREVPKDLYPTQTWRIRAPSARHDEGKRISLGIA